MASSEANEVHGCWHYAGESLQIHSTLLALCLPAVYISIAIKWMNTSLSPAACSTQMIVQKVCHVPCAVSQQACVTMCLPYLGVCYVCM